MGSTPLEREPHAVLDLPSRRLKGLKIERLRARAARLLHSIPDPLLKPLRRIIPTLIYRIEPARP